MLALLLAAVPGSLVAQEDVGAPGPETVELKGVVVDAAVGTPLVGAVVRLEPEGKAVLTDDAGRFVFADVVPGLTQLVFDQLGYALLNLSLDVTPGLEPVRAELAPMPVVLEGLHVMADRLEARRQATGVSVRLLNADDFRSMPGDLFRNVRAKGGLGLVGCSTRREVSTWCIHHRGGLVKPRVYIDDRPAMGGLEELALYTTDEVHAVEIYRAGTHVRVYTRNYMKNVAMAPRALEPFSY